MKIDVEQFNKQTEQEAIVHFYSCLSVKRWADEMTASRPFESLDAMLACADKLWQLADESEHLEAFAGHPKIGDVSSLAKKYQNTEHLASNEQSGVNQANDETLHELSALNQEYAEKFGFIFIVFATNKTAFEMLNLLKGRINNSREEEINNAANEQLKITQLRLRKLLS